MAVIRYLTDVEFDFGVVGRLPEVLTELGIDRPLLVTDPGLAGSALMEQVAGLVAGGPAATYRETPSNPNEAAVDAAAAVFREHGCDGLIALGGGSPMDLSKATALRVTHDGPLASYAAVEGGVARIGPGTPPVIAIPTTAGTGSEVGRAALITMKDGRKLGIISPHLIPRRALCDPELTIGLPPPLTAATGMDALAHCVETLLSPAVNPPAEAIALDGVARVAGWIETATSDGGNREARWQMMMAALEGGLTFQKGLGGVHALSHPLGSLRDPVLHHGTLNAVFLPGVLRFNQDHVGDKYDRLRHAMGLAEGADLAAAIAELNRRLGLPAGLGEMGVTDDVLPGMAEAAENDHCTRTNPRPAMAADYLRLLKEAMG